MLSQCYAQMKISFPGLIFAQYKSINIIIIILLKITEEIIRENAFEHKKKKPGLNLTPG